MIFWQFTLVLIHISSEQINFRKKKFKNSHFSLTHFCCFWSFIAKFSSNNFDYDLTMKIFVKQKIYAYNANFDILNKTKNKNKKTNKECNKKNKREALQISFYFFVLYRAIGIELSLFLNIEISNKKWNEIKGVLISG